MADSSPYIVVSGAMGAGKTTAARQLSEALGVPLLLERPDENPFLTGFYREPRKFAFDSGRWFLERDLELQESALSSGGIQDCWSFDAVYSYGMVFEARSWITSPQFARMRSTLMERSSSLRVPDLVIDLRANSKVRMERVRNRGHEYEKNLPDSFYLDELEGARRSSIAAASGHFNFLHFRTDRHSLVDSAGSKWLTEQVLRCIDKPQGDRMA